MPLLSQFQRVGACRLLGMLRLWAVGELLTMGEVQAETVRRLRALLRQSLVASYLVDLEA